ncbi:MAG TPA: biotin/lipoyl-containing protein [Ktedonobacteraceae bacterium]|nr:biotin/lipoyl-containing protein [Ktedonobacteraceae bacterium]
MPYISTVKATAYRIETDAQAAQREVMIDGKAFNIDWRTIAPLAADAKGRVSAGGHYSLIINGISYDIFARHIVKPDENGSQTYEIMLAEQRFEVIVEDEREKALSSSVKAAHEGSEARVRAPMPGLVINVPFAVGATVERGQTVVVLEAMKMENDLATPLTGTITAIRVNKGQTVNQGDVLVVVEGE